MFKAQTLRRGFSLLRRIPASSITHHAAREGHEVVRVQQVRFKRRIITRARVVAAGVSVVGAYGLLYWLDSLVDDEEEEVQSTNVAHIQDPDRELSNSEGSTTETESHMGEDADEEDDAEVLLFLPTGLPRARPQTFYKGSDPEWQSFVQVSKTPKMSRRIRAELVSILRNSTKNHPQAKSGLGNIKLDQGTVWLEIVFPMGPPVEYERPGWALMDDLVLRRVMQSVDLSEIERFASVIMPTAAANAFYADTKRRLDQTYVGVKKYLGYADAAASSTAVIQLPIPGSDAAKRSTNPGREPSADASPSTSASATSQSENPSMAERLTISLGDMAKPPQLDSTHLRRSIRFERAKKAAKSNVEAPFVPPRGCFAVVGLVEVIGDRAKATMEVKAAYDPKMGRYVNVRAWLRSVTPLVQKPMGGP